MEIIKKFTAVQIYTKTINDEVTAELAYGDITGPYYDRTEPKTEFETEYEAIEWAYKENEYGNWLILPIISFKREY
jgi:hypothetical protein